MSASGASSDVVLDPAAIAQLRDLQADGEPDVLEELVTMFLSDTARRLAAIRESVSEGRVPEVERAAHALAGGSAVFGAESFISTCRELQRAGREGNLDAVPELVERMEAEFERLRDALRQEIAARS